MFKNRIAVYGALAVIAVVIALAGRKWFAPEPGAANGPAQQQVTSSGSGGFKVETEGSTKRAEGPSIGGGFTLTSHEGETITEDTFDGKFRLMFFGYTFCPDICPTDLTVISTALDQLKPEVAKRIVPIFVSIDPERDTPQRLKEFVGHFHPRIIGATGTPEQISDVARKFRVYYAKVQEENSEEDFYLMDHSAITYLMGPNNEFLQHFGHNTEPEVMADRLRDAVAGAGS